MVECHAVPVPWLCAFREAACSFAGIKPDVVTYTTMMELYARVGNVERLDTLFREMLDEGLEPDVVAWSTLVRLYTTIGQPDDADWVCSAVSAPSRVCLCTQSCTVCPDGQVLVFLR